MVDTTKVNLKMVKCMEKAIFFGLMEENIKDIIVMISNMEKENLDGLMELCIKENLEMENNMGRVFLLIKMEFKMKVFGVKEKKKEKRVKHDY